MSKHNKKYTRENDLGFYYPSITCQSPVLVSAQFRSSNHSKIHWNIFAYFKSWVLWLLCLPYLLSYHTMLVFFFIIDHVYFIFTDFFLCVFMTWYLLIHHIEFHVHDRTSIHTHWIWSINFPSFLGSNLWVYSYTLK